jgi:hypothetical protein
VRAQFERHLGVTVAGQIDDEAAAGAQASD